MKRLISFKYAIIILLLISSVSLFLIYNKTAGSNSDIYNSDDEISSNELKDTIKVNPDRKEKILVESGTTFGELMTKVGINSSLSHQLYESCLDQYDLAKIKAGNEIELTFDKDSDDLKSLLYKINSEEEIYISKHLVDNKKGDTEAENNISTSTDIINTALAAETDSKEIWKAEKRAIPYDVKTVVKEAEVESSVYQAALDSGIDERAIIQLANAFQWSLDFAMDSQKGDTFKFVYEERYLDGEYAMPGQILAAKYVNRGNEIALYYFEENEDNKGFFDEDGNSVQKMFLKAPVAFKYISSGFTTGLRYVEAFNVSTGHRAIDYAAALGTPIRAVGDGTVVLSRYNGGYGNMISIRHNGTFTTNYAHLSKYAVSYGDRVKQGQVIGYVGSTGFSTGPHLHYEMVKNGVKVNPLREVLPPGEPIKEENQDRFYNEISKWQEMLK
ncbi:MAG: peptidoglycan DD-metalloendopeptidase family protein [Parcubacteria group bacterium]